MTRMLKAGDRVAIDPPITEGTVMDTDFDDAPLLDLGDAARGWVNVSRLRLLPPQPKAGDKVTTVSAEPSLGSVVVGRYHGKKAHTYLRTPQGWVAEDGMDYGWKHILDWYAGDVSWWGATVEIVGDPS